MTLLASWLRLPAPQWALALEAAAWLTLARILVSYVPMRYWRRHVEADGDGSDGAGRQPLCRAVGRMVAARRAPAALRRRCACLGRWRRSGCCAAAASPAGCGSASAGRPRGGPWNITRG